MMPALKQRFARQRAWWQQRAPREQRAIRLGGIVLLPTLLVFGLWLPANDHIRVLSARAALLERQTLDLRAMATWIKAQTPSSATAGESSERDLPARIEAELKLPDGVPGFKGKVQAVDGGVELIVEAAAFDPLLVWLGGLGKRERLFPVELELTAIGTPGSSALPGIVGGRIRLVRAAP